MITEKQTLAVVLNANSAEGMQAVKNLIQQYHRVLLVGDKREELNLCMQEIEPAGTSSKAYYVEADLTKSYDLTELISLVKYKFGGADHLVNCLDMVGNSGKATYELAIKQIQTNAMN
jgi:NAD(P)-dependent dehydrogenase (short-subunit alcohol dehydrogenase family)